MVARCDRENLCFYLCVIRRGPGRTPLLYSKDLGDIDDLNDLTTQRLQSNHSNCSLYYYKGFILGLSLIHI